MPAGSATYTCALASAVNVPVGVIPLPTIDQRQPLPGQYVLLTNQTNAEQNGIWYADGSAGLIPIVTYGGASLGAGIINPNIVVLVASDAFGGGAGGGGNSFNNTTWIPSTAAASGPGFVQT